MGDLTFRYVRVERRNHVLEVELNRPGVMNALHPEAHFELDDVWRMFSEDSDLWAAVLTGAGPAFCAGMDVKALAAVGEVVLPPTMFGGLTARYDVDKPIIAAVNGLALGGGLEMVLACDLAIASETARFSLPEVKVGMFAGAGGIQRLTRHIGRKDAMEMILTGRIIPATEALAIGLVNAVVPGEQLMESARALADRIVSNSPMSIRATKRLLREMEQLEHGAEAMALSGPILADLMKSQDFAEGSRAFAEKRAPLWSNR
jgi:enoyl-CoA hydratase/carnithine racemase